MPRRGVAQQESARREQEEQAAGQVYRRTRITTLDRNPEELGQGPDAATSSFVCGDACHLPFADATFDAVTLFDVLEHVPDDAGAAAEALRVTRPGGWLLVSTPDARWRYPYYRFMRRWCPPEQRLMDEWGHVRRGYAPHTLAALFGEAPAAAATFINPVTAFFHDVAFSRLRGRRRKLLYALAAPATVAGYVLHGRVHDLLAPGGEVVFYESNPWNAARAVVRRSARLFGRRGDPRTLMNRPQLYELFSEVGFIRVFSVYTDFLYAPLTRGLVWLLRNLSTVLENMPVVRTLAGAILLHAQKPPRRVEREMPALAAHAGLARAVSVVIPCRDEEMNVGP